MFKQIKLYCFSLLFIGFFTQAAITLDEPTQALKARINNINSFKAEFVQKVYDSQNVEIQASEGTTTLLQPNRFIWHTLTPDENVLQSDGETIWFYDPLIEQVTAIWLKDALLNNPILLLLQVEDNIWQSYSVAQLSADSFNITVKDPDSLVESIVIDFKAKSAIVTQLKIADRQGQNSLYTFKNVVLGTPFSNEDFVFTLPENTDLDDQRTSIKID